MNDSFFSMQQFFRTGQTRPASFRRDCLMRLGEAIESRQDEILKALHRDLGKHPIEAFGSEVAMVRAEIRFALKNLARWMRPQRRKTPLFLWPARSRIEPEPKGVVLIVGPWNYPFQLVYSPLVGALAAGNCAVVKPSEFTPHTAQIVEDLVKQVFDPDHCRVICGDAQVSADLCRLPWDHLFFTGSPRVGKLIMNAASRNLTPVTLELGGKSPCLVLDDADSALAAERIVWGKYLNAGQTCVAPDLLYVQDGVREQLIEDMKATIHRFFGSDPKQSPDYGRILNATHVTRLAGYLDGAGIVAGGDFDVDTRYFAPTIVTDLPSDSPLWEEEIFGPILPLVPFDRLSDLIEKLQIQPNPLALYVFTKSKQNQRRVLDAVPSGTACLNDTVKQVASTHLPLGGLGQSGMGRYHGEHSFDCFTHYRSVLEARSFGPRVYLPPFKMSLSMMQRFFKFFS